MKEDGFTMKSTDEIIEIGYNMTEVHGWDDIIWGRFFRAWALGRSGKDLFMSQMSKQDLEIQKKKEEIEAAEKKLAELNAEIKTSGKK
jgi:hypothetical protein